METFASIFRNIYIEHQGICPYCHGSGVESNITYYVESCISSALICDFCNGTGAVQDTRRFNKERVKDEMFTARYFHEMDPTQFEA